MQHRLRETHPDQPLAISPLAADALAGLRVHRRPRAGSPGAAFTPRGALSEEIFEANAGTVAVIRTAGFAAEESSRGIGPEIDIKVRHIHNIRQLP